MDRYPGDFDAYDSVEPDWSDAYGSATPERHLPEAPPSPVGQDERRMQVRAYNHWASLLDGSQFPLIDTLAPESLGDFGPHGVLLDFGGRQGIEDPAIRFLGDALAEECGGAHYQRLSDVPSGSLLSRITDHYLQILANQAPIGFEAEFVNPRGVTVLYRGILLPYSSDGVGIEFIFGVINWKEVADAATAEALFEAIDAALDSPVHTGRDRDMPSALDIAAFARPEAHREDTAADKAPLTLPKPSFGFSAPAGSDVPPPLDLSRFAATYGAEDDEEDEEGEDEDAFPASEWGAGFAGFGGEEAVYAVDYGNQGLEDGEEDEDYEGVVDPLADETASLGLVSLVARSTRTKASVDLTAGAVRSYEPVATTSEAQAEAQPQLVAETAAPLEPEPEPEPEPVAFDGPLVDEDAIEDVAFDAVAPPLHEAAEVVEDEPFELGTEYEVAAEEAVQPVATIDEAPLPEPAPQVTAVLAPASEDGSPEGLYDCLAVARELAQTARSSEDRGRKALYQAVARAYDFSLEAWANPEDFAELLADNGLTVQDRAPMTPVVKLVFGADYDKTRLTEYATVLGFAHRTGVARGTLDTVLARAEGGLKGIVQAERQARKEADGAADAQPEKALKPGLARKLRKVDVIALEDLPAEGPEFALVMVRRLPSGELVVVGEVPENVQLLEKAARALLA